MSRYFGYDEPLWFFGPWEFGLFDQGWVVAKRRVIRWEGKWPTHKTFARITAVIKSDAGE